MCRPQFYVSDKRQIVQQLYLGVNIIRQVLWHYIKCQLVFSSVMTTKVVSFMVLKSHGLPLHGIIPLLTFSLLDCKCSRCSVSSIKTMYNDDHMFFKGSCTIICVHLISVTGDRWICVCVCVFCIISHISSHASALCLSCKYCMNASVFVCSISWSGTEGPTIC